MQSWIALPDTSIGEIVQELGNNLMLVYQDSRNNYWFGSWGEGLYKYDGTIIIRYTMEDGLSHNRIDQILEDKAGSIYLKTGDGISKFEGRQFKTLKPGSQSSDEWKSGPDDLWFKNGQNTGDVFRYDGTTLHQLKFPATSLGATYDAMFPRSQHPNMNGSPYDVYTIYKDTRGNVWFGTAALGVCRFDGKSLNWITEVDVTEVHNGPSNGVRSIIEDKEGYFWFSNSLFRYDVYQQDGKGKDIVKQEAANAFTYLREKSIGSLDGSADGTIVEYLSSTVDNAGVIWFVTYRTGVYSYDGHSIQHYAVMEDSKNITLFSIFKDHQGILWVGTHENGVYRFNGKTFERFRP